MKKLLLGLFAVATAMTAFGQQLIRGQVTDADGEPVIGAAVVVDGTTTGTVTDLDGNFELTVPEGDDLGLRVSYIGYDPQVLPLGDQDYIAVRLTEGVALSEVVVTGYSQGTKREATGAISTIGSAELQAIPSGNVDQQLQGRASGVTVISNGQPGTQSKVRIRGFGSFNDNRPLFVVDGVPTNDVSFLAPNDIESTTILKDAAAASIYGARASGGVIVYETKKGSRTGSVQISYDGLIGLTTPGQGVDLLSPQEQAEAIYRARRNDIFLAGGNPDTANLIHPIYDFSDPDNIRLPDFIQVGDEIGRFGELTEEEIASYNDDLSGGRENIFLIQEANRAGTDWYDVITRNALLQRHNLGMSGGNEKSRFYAGLGYQDLEGIVINNEFTRYSLRLNSEFDLLPRLRVGENFQATFSENLGQQGGGGGQDVAGSESEVLGAFRIAPIIPARNLFGGYGGTAASGGTNATNDLTYNFSNARNPLANREQLADNTNNNLSVFGSVYAEFDIFEGLYARTNFGGNYGYFSGRNFGRATYENSENIFNDSYAEFNGQFGSWVWTNTLNYDFDLGADHNVKGLIGYEALRNDYFYEAAGSGINPFSFTPSFTSINTVNGQQVSSGFGTQRTFASVFGQVNYNFREKYYLTGVLRRDQSSAFGETVRSGVFPAVSAAWRVTGEDFAAPNELLSDLKVRAGYGIMGNANAVDVRNQFDLFGQSVFTTAYDINGVNNGGIPLGFRQTQIANPLAQWERSATINVGADATLFGTKLDVSLDLWQKRNEDVLFQVPLPSVVGSASPPFVNVATINNQGIDLLLTYRDRAGDFDWEATLTGSFLRNEIVEVAEGVDFFERDAPGSRLQGNIVRNQLGQAISSFFGYEVAGLWQVSDFALNPDGTLVVSPEGGLVLADGTSADAVQAGAAPGRFRFADLNGTDDGGAVTPGANGTIGPEDRVEIGNPVPDFTGGLNLRIGYKGFELETFLYTSLGNEIFNAGRWYTDFLASFTEASAKGQRVLDAWSPVNPDSDIPIAETASTFSSNSQVTSYYVEDGSYLRMRLLQLAYDVPTARISDRLTRLRVFANVNNVFTITGYTGLDPAVGGDADTSFGIDIGNYPVTRSFQFGVGVGF